MVIPIHHRATALMDATTTTRLIVAGLYAATAVIAGSTWRRMRESVAAPIIVFAAATAFIWCGWYLFLAIAKPPQFPWAGHVNRFLHTLNVALIVAAVRSLHIIREVRSSGMPVAPKWKRLQ